MDQTLSRDTGEIILSNEKCSKAFTVLMSVYHKDIPSLLDMALDSIFQNSLQPTKIILVYDGPIENDLDAVVKSYLDRGNLYIYKLEKNEGLASALNFGLKFCETEWIVRADSDDFNYPNRFLELSKLMVPELDLFGSFIEEIDSDGSLIGLRAPPAKHSDIKRYIKYRNPFNHMSVSFRRSFVLSAGGYPNLHLREDYALWATMIALGAKCRNIQVPLVRASTGRAMYHRRGGFKYALGEYQLQRHLVKCGFKNFLEAIFHGVARATVFLLANSVRGYIYENILRVKYLGK